MDYGRYPSSGNSSNDWFVIFAVIVAVAVVAFVVNFVAAMCFGDIAKDKGYNSGTWGFAAFFGGLPVWIMIIALPNKVQHREMLKAIREIKLDIPALKELIYSSSDSEEQSDELPNL